MEKLRYPTKYVAITQYYSKSHKAIDIASAVTYKGKLQDNREVKMIHEATIIENAYAKDYGWYVAYKFEMDGHEYIIKDGHFSKKSELVFGTKYPKGTFINYMDAEGTSNGKHDHHIMIIDGERVDPTEHEYIYPDQFKGDLESKDLLIYTEDPKEPELSKFNLGDKVNCKGYVTASPDGTGSRTLDQDGEVRYITAIAYGKDRPYHISKGTDLGSGDRGFAKESQLTKLD